MQTSSICYYIEAGPMPKKPKISRAVFSFFLTTWTAFPLVLLSIMYPERSEKIAAALRHFVRELNED